MAPIALFARAEAICGNTGWINGEEAMEEDIRQTERVTSEQTLGNII